MLVLGLLTCVVLSAFSAQAKVADNFNECKEFFYKDKKPGGIDQNAKEICQRLNNKYHYATLYSVYHKIPVYSAYTLEKCSGTTGRTEKWHLEPQISKPDSPINDMVPENKKSQDDYKASQAISSDYSDTGYDRGHLYPNSFSCTEDGRKATFTLTNAAPMDPCFNRVQWKNWESTLKRFLKKKLESDSGSAKAYIVTGAVPDEKLQIPQREDAMDSNRVTVPSCIWTAVCYKHSKNEESFSFGYIGENLPGGRIKLMSVSALNMQLNKPYKGSIEIFDENCFENNNKLNEAKREFQKLIDLQLNPGVQATLDVENTYRVLLALNTDGLPAGEKIRVTEMRVTLAFDSMSAYSTVVEGLKASADSACLITNYESVECQLLPKRRKIAADGSFCLSNSGSGFQCDTGGETKPLCSTPCLYQDKLKGYRCSSGQMLTLIFCSPPYSLVAAKGEMCLDDHPCGTYGFDYYWCKTTVPGRMDYCSPPLWNSKAANGQYCRKGHACAKYGESQQWCYTDDGQKNKCCTSDDSFSTVSGKTCKPDHPCDKYGKNDLWCKTTDGSSDNCCTS